MQARTKAARRAAIAFLAATAAHGFMLMERAGAVEESNPPVSHPASPPAPAAAPRDRFVLGSRSFLIPFTVETTGAAPVAVQLLAAQQPQDNATETPQWNVIDRRTPQQPSREFQFTAQQDGEYWFATRTIDAEGNAHPAGKVEPQLKVLVDTTQPEVQLSVDAAADGHVSVVLTIDDASEVQQVQLRYATETMNAWAEIDASAPSKEAPIQFQPPGDWKQVAVQVIATDAPGNRRVVQERVQRPRMAAKQGQQFAASEPDTSSLPPSGLRIQAAPFRSADDQATSAIAASNPVIQLDRRRTPAAAPDVANAAPTTQGGYGYRGYPATQSAAGMYSQRPAAGVAAHPYRGAVPRDHAAANAGASRFNYPLPAFSQTAPGTQPPGTQPPRTQPPGTQPPGTQPSRTQSSGNPPAAARRGDQTLAVPPSSLQSAPANRIGTNLMRTLPSSTLLPQEILPPPATAEQISEGFDLNAPGEESTTAGGPTEGSPTAGNANAGTPNSAAPNAAPKRPRTPAEAMRPIEESSTLKKLGSGSPEEVPAPVPEADPSTRQQDASQPKNSQSYEANRAVSPDALSKIVSERTPLRHSDSLRFSLAYELEAVGNLGVEAIELYGSVDGGESWQLWGRDPDRSSPFDIEVKEEGLFGFRIVVVGQNGLASPRPLAGDAPDIAVMVDTTSPEVRITGAQYGEGDRIGALVIQYECRDKHLVPRPIALSFSDTPEGPWTTIAAGLRNEREYVWPADPQLPRQLYLRIDATDEAGNIGSYILDRPIDAQGLAPRARIRGFKPLSASQRERNEQTAGQLRAIFK